MKKFIILIGVCYLLFIPQIISADNEPNNIFGQEEEIREGDHHGNVYHYSLKDRDVYKIIIPKNECLNAILFVDLVKDDYVFGYGIRFLLFDGLTYNQLRFRDLLDNEQGTIRYQNRDDFDHPYYLVAVSRGEGSYNLTIYFTTDFNEETKTINI